MVYYVCVFLAHTKPTRRNVGFVSMEKHYFKFCHHTYYTTYRTGDLLLWARNVKTDEIFSLGIFTDNDIVEDPRVIKGYEYDWGVKQGASRLYKIILNKYWCRDFKKTKGPLAQSIAISRVLLYDDHL